MWSKRRCCSISSEKLDIEDDDAVPVDLDDGDIDEVDDEAIRLGPVPAPHLPVAALHLDRWRGRKLDVGDIADPKVGIGYGGTRTTLSNEEPTGAPHHIGVHHPTGL